MSVPIELIKIISSYFTTLEEWTSFKQINATVMSIYTQKLNYIRLQIPDEVVLRFLNTGEPISIGFNEYCCSTCFKLISDRRAHSHTKGKYVCTKCNKGYYSRDDFNDWGKSDTCEHRNVICGECMQNCDIWRCSFFGCDGCLKKSSSYLLGDDDKYYCGYHYNKIYGSDLKLNL